MNKFYELFSLAVGVSAIFAIVFYLLTEGGCVIMFEPIWWIRIPEILIGFIVTPYYLIKLWKVARK